MSKYRIRLLNKRVVGPFVKDQIIELFAKGHIDGTEECQLFPAGEWLKILDFAELLDIFDNNPLTDTDENKTVLKKLSDISELNNKNDIPTIEDLEIESKLESKTQEILKNVSAGADKDLEKSSQNSIPPQFPQEYDYRHGGKTSPRILSTSDKNELKKSSIDKDKNSDKTNVTKAPIKEETTNSDKTVVNKSTVDYLKELKKEKEQQDLEEKNKKIQESISPSELEKQISDDTDDEADFDQKTSMVSLTEIRKELAKKVQTVEAEFHEEVKNLEIIKEEVKKSAKEKITNNSKVTEDHRPIEKEDSPKNTKKILLIALVGIALYFLFDEEKKPKSTEIQIFKPQIEFPIPNKQEDGELSKSILKSADELYSKGDLYSKHLSSIKYRESLENKFNENEALSKLILSYSELLIDVDEPMKSGNEVFKLIQIAKTKGYSDINVTMGIANYYNHFHKYNAAIKVLEDFLLLNKQLNQRLISLYVYSLLKAGNLTKAKIYLDKLMVIKDKNVEVYQIIAYYYFLSNEIDETFKILLEALAKFPKNAKLLMLMGDIAIEKQQFDKLAEVIKVLGEIEVEHSKSIYAKYFELKGFYLASKKKTPEAMEMIKKSLSIKDSMELRSKLAMLDIEGGDASSQLVSLSKTIDLMNKAKDSVRRKGWDDAFSLAIDAVDLSPKYFPAKILLSEIQIKKGFFNHAIKTLTELTQDNPNDLDITFALIAAYIDAYKFKEAQRYLDSLGATTTRDNPMFKSLMGKFYFKSNDHFQAINWFQKSININPINDEDYFLLAQTYLKIRQYGKAKMILNKTIDLDPSNNLYKVTFSKILYEMQDVDTAIGYLISSLDSSPNDPLLMSEIAINYYRSGQQKYFEDYKKKLEDMPDRDKSLYLFLIKASELDDKTDEMIKYSRELLKIEPGDLETRMQLAKILMDDKKYKEALSELELIEERLPTYPKLLYIKSKINLEMGKVDDAIKIAEDELKANPQSDEGNVLLGMIYTNSDKKDYMKAQNYYKEAQKINPKNIEALLGLAYINFEKNNIETSLDLYQKVIKLEPSYSYAHKQLGYVYKLLGQPSLAIEAFKVYLDLEQDAKDKDKINTIIKDLQ